MAGGTHAIKSGKAESSRAREAMKSKGVETKLARSCVLVLGADQSANRALSGILEALGCALPASRVENPGEEGSPKVRELNAELLDWAGSSVDDFTPFREEWKQSPGAKEFRKRAVRILQEEYGESALFLLGEEGLARLLPFWTEALQAVGADVKPIIMVRNPIEAAEALHADKGYTEPLSQMIWLRAALDAEAATRGRPRYHASFERLLQSWETVVAEAQETMGLPWPKPVEAAEFQAQKHIAGGLRYTKEAQARALTSNLLPAWIRETYMILNGWAMSEEMHAHYAKLDAIKAEFDPASKAFSRLVRAERHLALRTADGAEKVVTLQELEAEYERLQGLAAESDRQIAALKTTLQEERRAATLMKAELHQLKESRQDLEAELREAKAESTASRSRRKEMARVIDNRNAELKARYEELASLQKRILWADPSWHVRRWFGRVKRRLSTR